MSAVHTILIMIMIIMIMIIIIIIIIIITITITIHLLSRIRTIEQIKFHAYIFWLPLRLKKHT